MRNLAWGILCLVLAMAAPGETLNLEALNADPPPVIDGHFDEALWQRGDWHTGFHLLNKPDTLVEVQTHFKVALGAAAVYFAIRADEPDLEHQVKTITDRDGKVYHDDCLEVMLGADRSGSRYLHLIVNPLGTLYDAEVFNEGGEHNTRWDADIEAGVAAGDDSWTLELAIPLVEMGLSAKTTGPWILNVARERRTAAEELSSFAPLTGGFHQPSRYALLELPAVDLAPLLWALQYPYDVEFTSQDGELFCSARTRLRNQTGRARTFLLRPTWTAAGRTALGTEVSGELDDGQERELAFTFPLAQQGNGALTLEVRDMNAPETLWAVRKRNVELHYVPIDLEVLSPCYRNAIYATQSPHRIHAVVKTAVSGEERNGAMLRVALTPRGRPDQLIVQRRYGASQSRTDAILPIPELPVGTYCLTARLERGGQTLHQVTTTIRKLPPAAREWRLDEHNVLLYNGKPFLPFGWFSMPAEQMAAPECPFNVTLDYNAMWRSLDENRAFLDAYAAAGKVITIYPYPNTKWTHEPDVWGRPLTETEAEELREHVRALKDHPGLFAWYMADEPELRPASTERMEQIYAIVADEDPYHPCIMLNDTIAGIHEYRGGGDILMPDPYPCFLRDGLAALPIEKVTAFMRACQSASAGRKGIWITPQAFNYGDYGRENNRAPTFTELRNMTYQAVAQRTTGFLYYIWSHSQNYMSLQVGLPFLAREVMDLEAAILAPESGETLEVTAQAPEHVHGSVRRAGGAVFVFLINTATEAQTLQFSLETLPPELFVVSENRVLQADGEGRFEDRFERYATHIYTSDEAAARRETLTAARAEIARRDAARKRPGNLAFEDTGVAVRVSSKSTYGSTPERIVDGIRDGMGWRDGTSRKCPDWVELQWPAPVMVGRAVLFTETVDSVGALVPNGVSWKEAGATEGASGPEVTLVFSPVTTDRLRLEIRKNTAKQPYTRVTEIEVYAE